MSKIPKSYTEVVVSLVVNIVHLTPALLPFTVHSHNEFLLAILTRCQILVSTPGKGAGIHPRRWLQLPETDTCDCKRNVL